MNGYVTTAVRAAGRHGSQSAGGETSATQRYRFADLELDLGRRELRRGDMPVKLTKLTFNLLAALVRRAPNLVRHDELAALAWGSGRVVTPEAIAQRIMVLRRSLGDAAGQPRYIEGRRSEGYRLVPTVTPLGLAVPNGLKTPSALLEIDDVPVSNGAVPAPSNRHQAEALYAQALTLWGAGHHAGSVRTILNCAIGIDPLFAPAFGLLAYLDATAFIDTISAPAADRQRQADLERSVRSHSAAALALDPELGPAHAALASLDLHTWRWSAARRGFDRGGDPGWVNDLAPWFYCWTGDFATGVARAEHNLQRYPTSWVAHCDAGIVFAYARKPLEARRRLERAAELAPANAVVLAWLAYLAAREGRVAVAKDKLQRVEGLFEQRVPLVLLPELAYAYGRIGDEARAATLFDEIGQHEQYRALGCGTWAAAHLAVGDARAALAWLDRAAEKVARQVPDSGFLILMNLKMNFLDDPLLAGREFVRALARLRGH